MKSNQSIDAGIKAKNKNKSKIKNQKSKIKKTR